MGYRILVLMHVLAAVAFFSNAVAATFWKLRGSRSRDPAVIAHTFRTLMAGDRWITPVSVTVLVVSGVYAAHRGGLGILSTGWILWSSIALVASGIVFGLKVLPLQRDLARWTSEVADTGARLDRERYRRESRRWSVWAHLSLLFAFVGLVLMIVKPDLPALHR